MRDHSCPDCAVDDRGHEEIETILAEGALAPEERALLVSEALSRGEEMTPNRSLLRPILAVAAAAAVLVAAILYLPDPGQPTGVTMGKGGVVWMPYTPAAMKTAWQSGSRVAIYQGDLERMPSALADDETIAGLLSQFICLYLEPAKPGPHPGLPLLSCGVPMRNPFEPSGVIDHGLEPGKSLVLVPDLTILELGRYLSSFLAQPAGESLGVEWVSIPGGTYLTNSGEAPDRQPVAAFEISKYEVTNGQWHQYLQRNERLLRAAGKFGSYVPRHWGWDPESGEAPQPPPGLVNRPVVFIPARAAVDFCKWAGGHLPTESEWEKAARGELDQRSYPWGDEWFRESESGGQVLRCNSEETGLGEPLDVRAFGQYDVSPYGVIGMAGNVSEFVRSASGPCYRGGSYVLDRFDARIDEVTPVPRDQEFTWRHVGFRAARSKSR